MYSTSDTEMTKTSCASYHTAELILGGIKGQREKKKIRERLEIDASIYQTSVEGEDFLSLKLWEKPQKNRSRDLVA